MNIRPERSDDLDASVVVEQTAFDEEPDPPSSSAG
jgi:hypothetical protein